MATKRVIINDVGITTAQSVIPAAYPDEILDSEWAKNAFLIPDNKIDNNYDKRNRYYSTVNSKFTDGRLGCNIGINSKPQFTRYSDIRAVNRNSGRNEVSLTWTKGNIGMGRYYSEAIDDPSQTIYLRFGVPQFSGLVSFLSRAYDADMISLARTGRASSLLYKGAKLVGTVTSVVLFPQLATIILLGKATAFLFSRPSSKFYTVKPTMYTYWATVENLVNNIAVTRGLLPKVLDDNRASRLGQPYKLDSEQLDFLNDLMPEVFGGTDTVFGAETGTNNYIKVASIVNRAQRIANRTFMSEYEAADATTSTDNYGYLDRTISNPTGDHSTYITNSDNGLLHKMTGGLLQGPYNISARLNRMFMLGNYKQDVPGSTSEQDPRAYKKDPDTAEAKTLDKGRENAFAGEFIEFLDAEFRDGSQFAVFKVDHTGAVQESFGNAVQESDLSQKINQISSTAKQMRFNMAEGNMTGSTLEGMLTGVVGAVADVGKGLLDGATFGFSNILAGLGGAGYIDIPKYWQSSNATLPKSTYTIKLISPYGNVVSQIQNIYIPLCMLLAGSLPLSTGKASYTSPYLVQLFDRGRCQIQTGMIESLSISRGTSNLAFNTKGNPLAIDVSFSIIDLSSIMHMPISSGGLFETDTNMDDDSIMADYIAVLAGQDLYTQMYAMPRAKLRLAKLLTKGSRLTSPAAWAGALHDSLPDIVKNVIEGANRGSAVTTGSGIQS